MSIELQQEIKDIKNIKKNERVDSPWKMMIRRLRKNKLAMVGLGILIFMILFSFVGPLLSPHAPDAMNFVMKKKAPNATYWLGTDLLGRDILVRLMYAGRVSLIVGFVAVIIEIVIGGSLGAIAGYYGGWIDNVIMRVVDIFLCVPFLPILNNNWSNII